MMVCARLTTTYVFNICRDVGVRQVAGGGGGAAAAPGPLLPHARLHVLVGKGVVWRWLWDVVWRMDL